MHRASGPGFASSYTAMYYRDGLISTRIIFLMRMVNYS